MFVILEIWLWFDVLYIWKVNLISVVLKDVNIIKMRKNIVGLVVDYRVFLCKN